MALNSTHAPYTVTTVHTNELTPCERITTIRRTYHKNSRKTRSEVHDAIFSFGMNDRTSRLSDSEFSSQLIDEIVFLSDMSLSCLAESVRIIACMLRNLFYR